MKKLVIGSILLLTFFSLIIFTADFISNDVSSDPVSSVSTEKGSTGIKTSHGIRLLNDIPILTAFPPAAGITILSTAFLGLFIRFFRRRYFQLRTSADYLISIIGILAAAPVCIIVGILVKTTSRGPVFYWQERVGKDGLLFKMFKFRTMYTDAEHHTGPVWAMREDKRVTRVGRFLRRTHIDELPQLINVLKGEMSIIGPRPERPFFTDKFKDEIHGYTRRLSVKPGITGLAQCYHKYDETIDNVKRKLRYDVLYIKKMCWMLDMKILWKTVNVSLLGRKAS